MKTQVDHLHASGLDLEEEIQVIWSNGKIPKSVDISEEYRNLRRKCEIWVGFLGRVPAQDCPDIVSDALCQTESILQDPDKTVAYKILELQKALNRHRARSWRRTLRSRNVVPWDDFEAAAYRYLEPETTTQPDPTPIFEILLQEVLELLRKAWPYFLIALERLSLRDQTLFHQTYHLGHKPASPADLSHLNRNARNVALYRARQHFLLLLHQTLSDASLYGVNEEKPLLRKLLEMIETNRLKDLLNFKRER